MTREEALKKIQAVKSYMTSGNPIWSVTEMGEAFDMAIDALEQPERRWIPCSERLPNTNGIYIVTRRISDGFECRNITDACYFDGSDTWHDDTRVNHGRKYLTDVLAWCEPPEPYREEGEE